MSDKPKRRWYQFSLKAMLIGTALASVPLAWLAYERNEVRKREAAIAAIQRLGGKVYFDQAQPFRPNWLRPLLGFKSLGEVTQVNFDQTRTSDADLAIVASLSKLRELDLVDTAVTDAGLVHLAGLTELEALHLRHTNVTDAGLVHLRRLTKLQWLWIGATRITDQGIIELRKTSPKLRTVQ